MTTAFEVVTEDGVVLHGSRWDPPPGGCRASVVIVHGFGASSDEQKVVALAEACRVHGARVVAVDSRGHGRSGGAATLGDLERHDVAAAVTAATVVAPGTPLVLVAASVGAIAALRFVVDGDQATRIGGMVIVSCPARWTLPRNARGVLSAFLTHTSPGRHLARRSLGITIARPTARPDPPIDLVPRVTIPIAIVHGRDDPFIPVSDAVGLDAVARAPHRLDLVDGMGHAFEASAIPAVLTAVDWVLGSAC
jgi:uncharacterized protein